MVDHPERIGRYHVVGHLASGGMAEIFLGKVIGPSGFERPVVIKRILPSLAKKEAFVQMFLDEARVVAKVQHANVVHVHELGDDDGELYMVMEYLEGESLSGLMRRSKRVGVPVDRALAAHIVAQACAGLHAAHELEDDDGEPLNLVHRDVSPSNIVVTYSGGVKVLDFGIAKFEERSTETEAGQMKGKFAYMSPEQCLGLPVDRRSDVFALGIVLFEVTTGRRLFARDTSLLSMKAITEARIPSPKEYDPEYPDSLATICERALSREAADRYPTAAAMRVDLARALREMDGPAVPEEELATFMAELFADRLSEKRDLLRRVQAGSEITKLPEVEVDVSVELSDAGGTPFGVPTPSPRPGRVSLLAAVAVLLVAIVIGASLALFVGDETVQEPLVTATQPAEPPPVVEPPPEPDEPVADEAPAVSHVLLSVDSTPGGASVFVEGEDRGVTPIDLRVPAGSEIISIELRREGYVSHRAEFVPTEDGRVEASLRREARTTRRHAPTKQPAGDPFRRFN